MFVDASAVLAIFLGEPDQDEILDRLENANTPLTISPIAVAEIVMNFADKGQVSVEQAVEATQAFIKALNIRNVPITPEIGIGAIRAFAKYGRRRHKASLNMGDCFSYACAKNYSIPLLYKGNDFIHTDLK
ncbi:type II toxin-antitoxin system VapC family toxin [Microvirga sp. 2TAF3]|uniref:type II toxin-antitoxin system VapC family toxin n=1 Tax=Microvirga sp. 2TAF3 TaxID=3233014 RepID=UPI003F971178